MPERFVALRLREHRLSLVRMGDRVIAAPNYEMRVGEPAYQQHRRQRAAQEDD